MEPKKVFFRTGYNYDTDLVSLQTGLECKDESKTVQSEKDDADINVIVKRFGLTGQLPQNVRVPLDVDFVDAVTFQDAMNAVRAAEESFMEMPADVRARFGNDPEQFANFCTESKDGKLVNLAEMRKLGLAIENVPERNIPLEMLDEIKKFNAPPVVHKVGDAVPAPGPAKS